MVEEGQQTDDGFSGSSQWQGEKKKEGGKIGKEKKSLS